MARIVTGDVLFDHAQRFVGIKEMSEKGKNHPLIQWWLSLCGFGLDAADEIPWCSAFINGMAWDLRLPRSKSAMARSWLEVGAPVRWLDEALLGDVVIFKRGAPPSGHVGLFVGRDGKVVHVLSGNQGNMVSIRDYLIADLLGVRRIT